ncbi:MAG TPA: diaminopimelate epimerase [Thermoanaerobaculia bacterium]|nr:diaminopimelate epimerase [Thermoanaerobaculia bacterium]
MTTFFKVSGSGNDFLALAEPAEVPTPERIRAWCRRGISLGADGLFVLRRRDGQEGGVAMEYFNSDGHPAALCLNGTRCAAQLAFHLGWGEGELWVGTDAGSFAARRVDESRITLEVPAPETPREAAPEVDGITRAGMHLRVGVPHFVQLWPESLETAPVRSLGAALRHHPVFGEEGANVNFVRFAAEDLMEIRTYERGVEDETLSCGTGVLASAAVGVALGKAVLPLRVLTRGGFELGVEARPGGRWRMTGDARVVAHGELLPGAEAREERESL